MELWVQDDVLQFLDKVLKTEGEPVEHTRIVNTHLVSSLWSILMIDKLEKAKLDESACIGQEN